MHNSEPIAGPDFVLHSAQMILYRLFRQAKLVRNFHVRQALRNQRNDLLLAPRQAQPRVDGRRVYQGRLALEEPEQQCAQQARTLRLARMHRLHSLQHVLCRGIPRQVPSDSRSHILKKSVSSSVIPTSKMRTVGAINRTCRITKMSSTRLPREVSSRMSAFSSSNPSTRKGPAQSNPSTSMSPCLIRIASSAAGRFRRRSPRTSSWCGPGPDEIALRRAAAFMMEYSPAISAARQRRPSSRRIHNRGGPNTSVIPQPHSAFYSHRQSLRISHRTYVLGPDFVGTVFVLGPISVLIRICHFTSELPALIPPYLISLWKKAALLSSFRSTSVLSSSRSVLLFSRYVSSIGFVLHWPHTLS